MVAWQGELAKRGGIWDERDIREEIKVIGMHGLLGDRALLVYRGDLELHGDGILI